MSEFQIKKRNILISMCPFHFDNFLVQSKIISEYLLHLCGVRRLLGGRGGGHQLGGRGGEAAAQQ